MTLDDLKSIDINNISGWPLPIKIAGIGVACLVILFAGYYFIIADELTQLDEEQKKEEALKGTFSSKKALAINLEEYKRQMEEMGEQFGTLLRQLPNKTEVPNLLVDINVNLEMLGEQRAVIDHVGEKLARLDCIVQ